MGSFRHLLTLIVMAAIFRWLWASALTERASMDAGRAIFLPTRAIRTITVVCCVLFTGLFLWSSFSASRKPDEWWVPYLFLSFVLFGLFTYPPTLSIEVEGIGSRVWWRREKKLIRWEEVASLHLNTGSKQFVVRAKNGRTITHGGFNADQAQFLHDIRERTRLPLKVTRPGTWKSETHEVPYEDESEEEGSVHA